MNLQKYISDRTAAFKARRDKNFILTVLGLAAVLLLVLAFIKPEFFAGENISSILIQCSATAIMAAGQVYVMVGGGIDLSIPAVMALSGSVGALAMRSTGNIGFGLAAIFAVSILAGLFNGIAVARFKMMAFVVTMVTMIVCNGLATMVTKSQSIPVPRSFTALFGSYYGPVHATIAIMAVCLVTLHIILKKTAFGRCIYALGTNKGSAETCGIKTDMIQIKVFLVSGVLAGISAVLLVARLGSSSLSIASDSTSLDVIAAAIVGGASIHGGVGTAAGALFGALVITAMQNVLVLFGIDYYTIQIIKGLVFIFITYFDTVRMRMRGE